MPQPGGKPLHFSEQINVSDSPHFSHELPDKRSGTLAKKRVTNFPISQGVNILFEAPDPCASSMKNIVSNYETQPFTSDMPPNQGVSIDQYSSNHSLPASEHLNKRRTRKHKRDSNLLDLDIDPNDSSIPVTARPVPNGVEF